MRPGVAVVTDSTPYLPRGLVDRWGIREVSLYVGWYGDLRPEHEYDDLDAFYARLRESPTLPATSQPSVGDFRACYEPFVSAGRDVVSVHIAAGISGTCESATEAARSLAKEGHPGRIEVVDSQTGAGGLGCLVVAAARAASKARRWTPSSMPCATPASASRSGFVQTHSNTCGAAGASGRHRRWSGRR
jgi:DegV family protein with EDD domain